MNDFAPQGSEAWFAERLGKVTASRIAELMAKTKTGYSASRANYLAELALERLTGVPTQSFTTAAMQHGIDTEPQARAVYQFIKNVEVQEVGFIPHPVIADAGCSPDGLVGDDGVLEIKAPQPAAHLDTLLNESIPDKYQKQIMWQLACSGRAWADYVSFSPAFPASMQMWTARVRRDPVLIKELETEVRAFLKELEQKVERLSRRYAMAA